MSKIVQIWRRYWYVFPLLVSLSLVLILLSDGWIGTRSQTAGTGTLSHAGGAPSQTAGTRGSVARPTPYRPGERLIIPVIQVNASIEPVGVLSDGDLAVPTQNPWDGVGWYQYGPYPGARGSAVIDGHLDRPGGYPAVFWRLHQIQVGDEVLVTNNAGETLHFRVKRIAFYTPQGAPLKDIFGKGGGTYLNLITCAGDWIPSQHQTTLRLVIYTALV
jgi:LPXTG-site transpeptidase (sortase) family protein